MALYRIYIDEVGNDDMKVKTINNPNEQYLSLTGVIFEDIYFRTVFYPALAALKNRYIPGYASGNLLCLHRKDILKRQNGFEFLNDTTIRNAFDDDLMNIIEETEYTVISVVIDKVEHKKRYGFFAYQPYYYCLEVIIERYVRFLEERASRGDVMIEARQKTKDRELKDIFSRFYNHGTGPIDSARIQQVITSGAIKIKPKEADEYGLQLADLIAYPSFSGMKNHRLSITMSNNFGRRIYDILNNGKYHRVGSTIWGVGKKWLP